MPGAGDVASLPATFWAAVRIGEGVQDPFVHFRALGDVPACSHATALALKDHRFSVVPPIQSDRPLWRMHNRWLISRNAPEHTAIRRRLTRAFTKTAVAGYRPLVTSTIDALLSSSACLLTSALFRLRSRRCCATTRRSASPHGSLARMSIFHKGWFAKVDDPVLARRRQP